MSLTDGKMPRGPRNILVAEPDDAFMMRLQMAMRGIPALALYHVQNEQALFRFLDKGDGWENAETPDMIFLDVSLLHALDRIKSGGPYSGVPVVVMGHNLARAQAHECHIRRATACIQKPPDPPGMRSLAAAIDAFWFKAAKLPPTRN